MLQRSSLPTSVSTEISDSLQQTFSRRRLEALQEMLWLPENYQQYLLLLAGVLAIGLGMMAHIWLNVQIAEERLLLSQLQTQRQQIERENSEVIFAIANLATLAQVEEAALQQGFRPATERVYVQRGATAATAATASETVAASPALAAAQPPLTASDDAANSDFIEAVGRGLGAAGEWLQQAGAAAADGVAGAATGFTERWMP